MPHKAPSGKKTGDGRYIATRLCICHSDLLIVVANAIFTGNRLPHSLKGMVGSGRQSECCL
jgi:hypothetical protein